MSFLRILAVGLFCLSSAQAFAYDRNKCVNFQSDGLYKKYEFGAAENWKKHGSTVGFTHWSSEPTTAFFDPKFWVHFSTSVAGFTSSFGPCKLIGVNEMNQQRELYIVQNKEELLKEVARAQGEHLRVLASFSLCEEKAISHFEEKLQKQIRSFVTPADDKTSYGSIIDKAVTEDSELMGACIPLS